MEVNVHKNAVLDSMKMIRTMFVLIAILLVINVLVLVMKNVFPNNVHQVTSNHFYLQPPVYLIVMPNSTIIIKQHLVKTVQLAVQSVLHLLIILLLNAHFVILIDIFLMENAMKTVLKTIMNLILKQKNVYLVMTDALNVPQILILLVQIVELDILSKTQLVLLNALLIKPDIMIYV